MDIGIAVSSVESLSAKLNHLRGKEFLFLHDCKSQIDRLLAVVSKVRDVFLRVAYARELSEQQRLYIMELEDAISDANRLLDKAVSRADRIHPGMVGGGLSKKVRLFCSCLNPHWVAYCISRKVQKLWYKFDRILTNTCDIAPNKPIREPQTYSYECEDSYFIGREDDVEKVVCMLLDPSNDQRDVSFVSIVGIGGLGKTTLAKLVFSNPRVTDVFSLKMWIWFTIEDQKQLDIDKILQNILASATRHDHEGAARQDHEGSTTMDQVKSQLREQLARHRYLLVLDYVWIENRDQWCDLVKHLGGGQRGSCVLVTTRSKSTAEIIGADHMHMLQRLSEENSWRLLKTLAFGSEINTPDNLVGVRQKIVNICAGLPLGISVVAGLLGDQDKSKPQSVEEIGSAAITESMDVIMAVDHYRHLESPLKSCFSYCYLFPKDFEIEKEKLKSLWMAQGYIVPLHEDQSIEDACEEYFSMLLNRFIFQDIKYDKYGQIVSCKIDEIMYDICQHVAGKEMCVMNTSCGRLDKDVRHLSVIGEKFDKYTLGKTDIRSYLHLDYDGIQVGKVSKSYLESLVANCLDLKALDLNGLIFKSLPDLVCRLIQLRYLNISGNTKIEFLPKSISELYNLQTLILRRCYTLKELPVELIRLDNLSFLDIKYCFSLTCMPRGMGVLTNLHNLSDYIMGGEHWNQLFDGLDDLKPLHNLRGNLRIHIRWPKYANYVAEEDSERDGLCMGSMEHLNAILFDFIHDEAYGSVGTEEAKRLIEKLQPHHNLKYLEVKKYHGLRMPGWVTHLKNLVELHLTECRGLTYLPYLGNLLCLKVLRLIMLANLECIGEDSPSVDSSSTFVSYLPPLETLEMSNLPKLKGWRRGVEDGHQFLNDFNNNSSNNKAELHLLSCFSYLKSLFIWNCPELTCFPPCPKIEDLTLLNFNRRMQMIIDCERDVDIKAVIPFASSLSWSPHFEHSTAIKKVTISNMSWINSVPIEAFQFVESLEIWGDKELGSLGDENVFHGCSSSLRYLMIGNCCTLRSVVPGGLEHLTVLEMLEIRNCNNFGISEEHQEEGVKCIGIAINDILPFPSLRTLTLHGLPQLVNLPNWMQFMPVLHSLKISFCNRLKSMPNWMPNLQSLTHLTVSGCSKILKRRCQTGKDWHYIKHIQNIQFQDCFY